MDVVLFAVGVVAVWIVDLLTIAARSALRKASLARVLQLKDHDEKNAKTVLNLMGLHARPYAGLHLLQSVLRMLLIVGIVLALYRQVISWPIWLTIVIMLLVGLVIALSEWTVERIVSRNPEKWVVRTTIFIRIVNLVFYPFASLMLLISGDSNDVEEVSGAVTEDELKTLVDASEQDGVIEQEERQMIYSIFQLDDTLTREIMVPRIDVITLEVDTPISEAMDKVLESGYSRVPVYDDTVDNIMGLLYAKDLILLWRQGKDSAESIHDILREPYFVPEAKKVDELLTELQSRRVHMAIVVDEYGGVAGVVTLEDIIEEIFGEIQDEYDENEELPYQILDDGSYLFRGRVDLDDFNEMMDADLPVDEADTLGGFLYMRFGHVPMVGEQVEEDGLSLTVEQVSSRRIRKVRAQRTPEGEANQDNE